MLKDQTVAAKLNEFSMTRILEDCYYGAVTMDFEPPLRYQIVDSVSTEPLVPLSLHIATMGNTSCQHSFCPEKR